MMETNTPSDSEENVSHYNASHSRDGDETDESNNSSLYSDNEYTFYFHSEDDSDFRQDQDSVSERLDTIEPQLTTK